jgi:excinuclease ABC subunit A
MGPEGGDAGGEIIAKGTPEEISKQYKNSFTGEWLKKMGI